MGKREKKIIKGTSSRPRLAVFRSHNHIYAQVIDDSCSRTLVACSTLDHTVQENSKSIPYSSTQASRIVGEVLGKKLLEKNIKHVVFDRRDKPYHGRVKALADGARTAGVDF